MPQLLSRQPFCHARHSSFTPFSRRSATPLPLATGPWLESHGYGQTSLRDWAHALNVAIHRLRQRFLKLVRAEVEATTLDPADLAEEFRHLVEVLAKE